MARAAAGYVRRGFWVVALASPEPDGTCSCGDSGCLTPGKHLRNACASRTLEVVRGWWRCWPRANVGLPTGPRNGLLVLDIDSDQGGERSLARLVRRFGPLPPGPEVRTGGGGRHLYFRFPRTSVASANGWREGIDIRGEGGYVVAPPSRHRSGKLYRWMAGRELLHRLPPAPGWLLSLLHAEGSGPAARITSRA